MQDLQGGCEERLSERMQVVLIQGSHHVSAKKIEAGLSLPFAKKLSPFMEEESYEVAQFFWRIWAAF
jgi:hypothetical protein